MDSGLLTRITYILLFGLVAAVVFLISKLALQRDRAQKEAEDKEQKARNVEDKLRTIEGKLEGAMKASTEFEKARKMLHDVRGSLSPIICYANELSDLAVQIGEPWLRKVSSAIKLQSLYTADVARFNVPSSTFNVAELLRYLSSLHSSIQPDGVKVNFLDTGQKRIINNRFVTVFRLFVNLINNARKSAEKAGGNVTIEMDDKEVRISNRFTGILPLEEIYNHVEMPVNENECGIGLKSVSECASVLNISVNHHIDGDVITFKVSLPGSI